MIFPVPLKTLLNRNANNANKFGGTMSTSGAKVSLTSNLPVRVDEYVEASQVQFTHGSQNVNGSEIANRKRRVLTELRNKPDRDVLPVPVSILPNHNGVVGLIVEGLQNIIITFP